MFRYRLRTLLIVATAVAVVAAVIGSILASFRPVSIRKSWAGSRAIRQVVDSEQIEIELSIDGTNHGGNLLSPGKAQFLLWLKTAVKDVRPMKRTVLGRIRFGGQSSTDWFVLQINPIEVSVQTPNGTWRNLDRKTLETIVVSSEGVDE